MIEVLRSFLPSIYANRPWVASIAYGVAAYAAFGIAFLIRFEFQPGPEEARLFFTTLPAVLAIRVGMAFVFKLHRFRWRYSGTRDVIKLAAANAVGTIMIYVAARGFGILPPLHRSIILLEWFLSTFLIAALWIAYRTAYEEAQHLRAGRGATAVLIVGAGEAGTLLAREMMRTPTGYRPVGFIDDDKAKWDTRTHGIRVFGPMDALPKVVELTHADELAIAIPSAKPEELRRVVELCEQTRLRFKVLPGITAVLGGRVRLHHLRELRIEDLLGRDPIALELPALFEDLHDRAVLITGAAGSIGAELSRQVALHSPGVLILFDQAETPLFFLEHELRDAHPDLLIIPLVGDVTDRSSVERVFRDYAPSRVFHAAAYKHVPMMQVAPREAIRNNVMGTYRVADAAARHGAERFVLVSTDKAVRPTSIMGASKRLAEVVIQNCQARYPDTRFSAVRFGNVLGSNGSVIPVFQKQIQEGKPLTITHPEATRYFMTIPEAVQLILQASLLPEMRGSVAMLDMGEPVRIVDLAKNLLRLSGMPNRPGESYVFTGLRAGEKLHEELWDADETSTPTSIPKVRIVQSPDVSIAGLDAFLSEWEAAFEAGRDQEVLADLHTLFPGLHGRPPQDRPRAARDTAAAAAPIASR